MSKLIPTPTTLRARLVLGTATATAVILLAAGLVLYFFVRESLVSEFDGGLAASARALAAMTELDKRHIKMEPEAQNLPEFSRADRPDYFTAWLDDGKPLAASTSLGNGSLSRRSPAPGTLDYSFLTLPDGQRGRQLTLKFVPAVEDPEINHAVPAAVTLALARHTAGLDAKLRGLAWLLAFIGCGATCAAAGVMGIVVSRGLRPLEVLAGQISTFGRESLGERIELAHTPGELTAVVLRLNELLERLQVAVVRERMFTADVAHELRTPLAGLEATLDVCATRRRTPDDYARTVGKCQRIVRAMHAMVDNLLRLARAESHRLPINTAAVPLGSLVQESWNGFESAAVQKQMRATFEADPQLCVHADAEKLRIVVNNLLDNAVAHADAGGWLRVEVRVAGDRAELHVSNSGSTLTHDEAQQAFERFWRGDAARRDTGQHCGLGLSLCREMTALLAGQIEITSERGGAFAVCVSLPLADGTAETEICPRAPVFAFPVAGGSDA